ncbi:MAG: hypothetical protein SGILL_001952 [Bacillariaceae sp.]
MEDGNTDEEVRAIVDAISIPDRPSSTTPAATNTAAVKAATNTTTCTDQLERCGRWLSSIPRDDVTVLRETPEYQAFLEAFERLGCAHRRVISGNHGSTCSNSGSGSSHSNSPSTVVDGAGTSAAAAAVTPVVMPSSTNSNGHSPDGMVIGSSQNSSSDDADCVNSTVSFLMSSGSVADASSDLAQNSSFHAATIPSAISTSAQTQQLQHRPSSLNVFTQYTDDVLVNMLQFLESQSLIRASRTCSRFQQLSHQSAAQRTHGISQSRQLPSVMQLLRAQEQIVEGDHYQNQNSATPTANGHVRVPMLLLGRRIVVTDAGDPEYNGVYYCTNANGNGFVFTKPRYPIVRLSSAAADRRTQNHDDSMEVDNGENDLPRNPLNQLQLQQQQPPQQNLHGVAAPDNDALLSTRYDGETPQPGQPLRCIVSKRYSNDTLLWYMSKEVENDMDEDEDTSGSNVREEFSFWGRLMVLGTASSDACRYPSQTSVLTSQGGEGWRSLSVANQAPTVELMD